MRHMIAMNNMHALFKTLNTHETENFSWLHTKRTEAMRQALSLGFPTSKDNAWRYTPLNILINTPWQIHPSTQQHLPTISPEDGVIMDIHAACEHYPEYLQQYLDTFAHSHAFDALNMALFQQGVFILIKKNVCLTEPIYLDYPLLSNMHMACYRNVIILEEGAQATIVESNALPDDPTQHTFTHAITEVSVNKNAQLTHLRQQQNILKHTTPSEHHHFHLSQLNIQQHAHSQSHACVVNTAGDWNRSDTHIKLTDEYAHCVLNGLTFGENNQYSDHHTIVEHLKPHGTSDEYYKSILNHQAKGVFDGKVIVLPHAIQTQASQSNKALLLSRSAQMNTKPQLEIFSDDVKCTHGATIGQLDEEALFYLQTRGIDEATARKLLIDAFLMDIIARMPAGVRLNNMTK